MSVTLEEFGPDNSTTTTTLTLEVPYNAANGDLLLAQIGARAASLGTVTPPAGWSSSTYNSVTLESPAVTRYVGYFWKFHTEGPDPVFHDFVFSALTTGIAVGRIQRWSGARTAANPLIASSGFYSGTDAIGVLCFAAGTTEPNQTVLMLSKRSRTGGSMSGLWSYAATDPSTLTGYGGPSAEGNGRAVQLDMGLATRVTVGSTGVGSALPIEETEEADFHSIFVLLAADPPPTLIDRTAAYVVRNTYNKSLNAAYRLFFNPGSSLAAKYAIKTLLTLPPAEDYTPAEPDPWRPKIYPGDFFVGGERYHIFARKHTKTLGGVTFSVFELAATPIRDTVVVTYAGLPYTDFFLLGNQLHLKWRNPQEWAGITGLYGIAEQAAWIDKGFMGHPYNDIEVAYDYLSWNVGTKIFDELSGDETFTIRDNEFLRYYRLYDEEVGDLERVLGIDNAALVTYKWYGPRLGPVVLTDDAVLAKDDRGLVAEFSMEPETGEILFAADNLIRNPSFEIVSDTFLPYEWTTGLGSPITATGTYPDEAAHSNRYLSLPSDALLHQKLHLRKPGPLTFSFYARVSSGTPALRVVINPIGVGGDYLDADGTASAIFPYSPARETFIASRTVTGTAWVRYTLVFGDDTFFTLDEDPVPDETIDLELRLQAIGGALHIDAVQLESGHEAKVFSYVEARATIEYESAPDENWVPEPDLDKEHPLRRDDVDLNPCQSDMPNGFLCFLEDGEVTDVGLQRGGTDIFLQANPYPQDLLGRYHLPYAKVSGLSKLQRRATFHLEGSPIEDELPVNKAPLVCGGIDPIIPEGAYIEESAPPISHALWVEVPLDLEEELSVLFKDQFGNPIYDETCSITQIGVTGTTISFAQTDQAGRASLLYRNQEGSASETVEFAMDGVSFVFNIDVTEFEIPLNISLASAYGIRIVGISSKSGSYLVQAPANLNKASQYYITTTASLSNQSAYSVNVGQAGSKAAAYAIQL